MGSRYLGITEKVGTGPSGECVERGGVSPPSGDDAAAICYNERMIAVTVCYCTALLLELLRLVRRRYCRTWAVLGFAVTGFVLHSWLLYQQHVVAEHPLGGAAMFFFAAAWGLVLLYFVWMYRYPNVPFGVIVLPFVLLLFCGGNFFASTFETTGLTLQSIAKMLHLVSAAGFVIALLVFIICRALHFVEVRLLRGKRSLPTPIKLPSLEWSSSIGRTSLVIAVCCFCFSALGGLTYLLL